MLRAYIALFLLKVAAFAQPVPLSGFSDQGAFLLYLNEDQPGRVTFRWTADGHFESAIKITVDGETYQSTLSLTPDAEGRWIRSAYESTRRKTLLERKGDLLTVTANDKNGPGKMPENMLAFAEDSPALIAQALRRYDVVQGGKQTFGVMDLVKVDGAPLTLEHLRTRESFIGGHTLKLSDWVFAKPKLELHVVAGEDGRVYLVTGLPWYTEVGVSEHHALFVREGYEELLPAPPQDSLISQPKYEVRVETVKMPMRDGVKLGTDIYFPIGVTKAPVILTRTPYGKEGGIRGRFYARRGYVYAIQDVRGRFSSEGQWEALVHEPEDGYDTIEWLARQPWSTGKVGMVGGSYLGWVQWLAAIKHPPHLVTIVPNVSPPDPFHNLPYDHGVVGLQGAMAWFSIVETNARGPEDVPERDWPELLKPLPMVDLDKRILGKESLTWRHWMAHPTADAYWRPLMFLDKLRDVRIPVFHQSGWFDGDGIGSKMNYLAMARYGHAEQKLTIGPWEHSDTASRSADDRDFGGEAVVDLFREYLRWFDYWLKGIDNGILKEPLVSLFTMGSNRWLHGSKYPLPETRFEKLYLASRGRLTFTPPAGAETADHYDYDPGDPTPDPDPPADRKDILVYTTPPFEKPYTIAGPMSAVLYASSSARDTDWFIHVVELDEEGKSTRLWANYSAGQLRARYRNSAAKTELIEPGKVYRYDIDLWHTGVTIAAGHQLRVQVSSAAFPTFSRNLNTGGNNATETKFVKATQMIYHDRRRASHIVLPRIP